jgi:hypothetical protein
MRGLATILPRHSCGRASRDFDPSETGVTDRDEMDVGVNGRAPILPPRVCWFWPGRGWSLGLAMSCCRSSGAALIRRQWRSSMPTAIEVWLSAATVPPSRAPTHAVQPQFHWGMPPPAAAAGTITQSTDQRRQRLDQSTLKKAEGPLPTGQACQSKRPTSAFSELARRRRLPPHRTCVHVDFQTHRHFDDFWCFPGHYEVSIGFNEDTTRLPCLQHTLKAAPQIACDSRLA